MLLVIGEHRVLLEYRERNLRMTKRKCFLKDVTFELSPRNKKKKKKERKKERKKEWDTINRKTVIKKHLEFMYKIKQDSLMLIREKEIRERTSQVLKRKEN